MTYVPRVDLGQTNIIFNIPHPSLLLYIPDKETRNAILLLVQEIKRDIIVPHSKSGIVPKSSLLGAGQLGFWEVGKGGTIG
jgi:hypothetical protein